MTYFTIFKHSEKTQEIADWCKEHIGYGGYGYYLGEYDWHIYVASHGICTISFREENSLLWFKLAWGEIL